VTVSLGVPTVWLAFEAYLSSAGLQCSTLRRLVCGGSAVPPSMMQAFERRGIELVHAWGMTEMSPLGTVATLKAGHSRLDHDAQLTARLKQGRPPFGVQLKIVDDDGRAQPHDGESMGELLVRGPWIVSGYFNDAEAGAAVVDKETADFIPAMSQRSIRRYMQITDRRKDADQIRRRMDQLDRSENAAVAHDDVAEAAVIAVPHPAGVSDHCGSWRRDRTATRIVND
jgi:fatty-acyl-CoA synthase